MKAHLRRIRISPKKANLVAGMVRGKKATEALDILKFMPKKGADILYKVVHSAVSNAKNNFKQSVDELYITRILVTKGPTYKRSLPISRGRVHPIAKRTSHITVEVGLPGGKEVKASVKEEKAAPKAGTAAPKAGEAKKEGDRKKKASPKKKAPVKKAVKKNVKEATPESGQDK